MKSLDQAFIKAYRNREMVPSQSGSVDRLPAEDRPQREGRSRLTASAHEPLLRAAFQVDRFAWPDICRLLETAAGVEIDHLFEAVRPAVEATSRIVGIGSAQRGEGATTVFLAIARRLGAERCPAVLVDADWSSAGLARRLGLLPELGWEEALAGRVAVDDTLIESVDDGLGLLPLGQPQAREESLIAALGRQLSALRSQYPVVLVNLGAVGAARALPWGCDAQLAGLFDLMILVRDCGGADAGSNQFATELAAAGFRDVAIAENFAMQPLQSGVGSG